MYSIIFHMRIPFFFLGKLKKLWLSYVFCSCTSLIRRMGLQQLIIALRDNKAGKKIKEINRK